MKYPLSIIIVMLSVACLFFSCEKEKKGNDSPIDDPKEESLGQSNSYDHLKEISWLVGNWVDDDENVELTLNYRWDESKNFIIEHFKMNTSQKEHFEGFQIIGWDPYQQRIRSWIFDNNGGFGESSWYAKKGNWYTRTLFTLQDGRQATATHIYRKLDETTYSFSSENREIGGTFLPNLGPFKVVRKKG